jgi:hypothetical protein
MPLLTLLILALSPVAGNCKRYSNPENIKLRPIVRDDPNQKDRALSARARGAQLTAKLSPKLDSDCKRSARAFLDCNA